MEWTLTDVLIDFSKLSVLLMIAAWLRRKLKFLQIYYIPAALVAGLMGLVLGPHVLGKFSPLCLTFSPSIGQWAGVLTTIVFACSFLGLKLEKVTGSALQTYFLAGSVHQAQVLVGLTLTFLLGLFIPNLPFGFGLLPVLGFYGGHGMAIAGGVIYDDAGYMLNGTGVASAATFATIGMVCGIVVGMIFINRAGAKGLTTIQMKREEMPEEMLTGYFSPANRKSIGSAVTHSATLDPLASQLMLVGFIILCGYFLRSGLIHINPFFKNLPLFACCLIFSMIFTICTQKCTKINDMMDRTTIVRISSAALEYMIASALATTNISVFADYGLPLIIVGIGVTIATWFFSFVMAKYMLPKNGRFETSVGLFGQCCGVLATGLLLLKVVDPEFKTNAATNITSSSTLGYTYQLQYTLVFITLCMTRPLFVYLWSWALMIILLGLGLLFARRLSRRGEL